MNLWITFKVALRAIVRNKLRAVLTMLGIIIGVGAVIAMVSIGEGAKASVEAQIESFGTHMLYIIPGSATQSGARSGLGSAGTLTMDDVKAIEREVQSVRYSAPSNRTVAQVVLGDQNWSTIVVGTTPPYQIIRNWSLEAGEFFTQSDIDSAAKVCVLGKIVSDNLFGIQNPVDRLVRIKNVPFKVIGVLAPKGQSSMGQDQDDTILIPITTLQRDMIGSNNIGAILVSAATSSQVDQAQKEIAGLLHQRHKIPQGQTDDFSVRNLSEAASHAESIAGIMTLLLGSIASVSLVVGGIGIMNIMLVSVTERTREIGIRMAVGASSFNILFQFLVEAVVLSILGGGIGIFLGVGSSYLISHFAQWPVVIGPTPVFLAFLFALMIGTFFGYYPAYKASKLDPIEALRYE